MNSEQNDYHLGVPDGKEVVPVDPYRETIETLESIDFATLQEIFAEIRRRSNVDAENELFAREHIEVLTSDSEAIRGEAFTDGSIVVNPFEIASGDFAGDMPKTAAEMRRRILSVLVHEQSHVVAHKKEAGFIVRTVREFLSTLVYAPQRTKEVGYATEHVVDGNYRSSFKYFNEGVTDKIAETVYAEYLRRTGDRSRYAGDAGGAPYWEAYPGSRAVVTTMVEMVANATDVPSDVVWESLISGAVNGVDLDSTELAGALNDICFPEFVQMLKEAELSETELPLPELLQRVKAKGLSDDAKEKIKDATVKFHDALNRLRDVSLSRSAKVDAYFERMSPDGQ